MDVDLASLALAEQVLRRQEGHAGAMREHLQAYGTLSTDDMGYLLGLLHPINEAILATGTYALDLTSQVYRYGAEKMGQTREAYIDAEREAHQAAAEVAARLGTPLPAYVPPSAPDLGAALSSAGPDYASPDPNVAAQALDDIQKSLDWAAGTVADGVQRVENIGSDAVVEAVDVRSYLPTPDGSAAEIENIRWTAGVIFGSADWIWEELFGYSLLEEVTAPFTGDWESLKEASIAWTHISDALGAIAQNTSALVPPLSEWTGQGSEAFVVAASAMTGALTELSGPAGTVSTVISALAGAVKLAVGLILSALKDVSYDLLLMAASAAVPVAGWIADVIEGAVMIAQLLDRARTIYAVVNALYDLVSSVIEQKTAVVDAAMLIADLVEGLARGTAARVA